jgi:hypothetical protein
VPENSRAKQAEAREFGRDQLSVAVNTQTAVRWGEPDGGGSRLTTPDLRVGWGARRRVGEHLRSVGDRDRATLPHFGGRGCEHVHSYDGWWRSGA